MGRETSAAVAVASVLRSHRMGWDCWWEGTSAGHVVEHLGHSGEVLTLDQACGVFF